AKAGRGSPARNAGRSRTRCEGPMKWHRLAPLTALLLCMIATPGAAEPDADNKPYDKTWYVSKFWTGEYPASVAWTKKGVVVVGRAKMDKSLPRSIRCELPYLAMIHPWNAGRTKKNNIEFWSATKIIPLIAKEDFVFEGSGAKIAIKKGDAIEYVRYSA